MTNFTKEMLSNLEEYQLTEIILTLQKQLNNKRTCEHKAGAVHRYHFSSKELIKLNRERRLGSGVIMNIKDLGGKDLMQDTLFKDGLSNNSVNSLLDDMQYSYDISIELKPTNERIK